jgi:hypothetical protein
MSTAVIEVNGWTYIAFKENGEWWCDPLDPRAPQVTDVAAIEQAVWEAAHDYVYSLTPAADKEEDRYRG